MMEDSVLILWFTSTTQRSCQLEKVVLSKRMLFLGVAVRFVTEAKRASGYKTQTYCLVIRWLWGGAGAAFMGSGTEKTAGFCEQDDKTWGYSKCGEFLDQLRND